MFSGQQQRRRVSPLCGPSEGVPGPAGRPGATGPFTLSARERPLQSHHYVRTGIISQHPEETGSVGGSGLQRGGQLQHTMPKINVKV